VKWKNWFIKAFIWALNPEKTRAKHGTNPSSFLIVSTTGLGDTLWGTPAIRTLRQSYPESNIVVLTSEIGFQVLEHNKNIDELYVLSGSTSLALLRLLPKFKKKLFDSVLIFHTSQRLVLPFCALFEAPQMIGTAGINKDLDFLLTKPLKKTYQHEIKRRLDIVKEAGTHISDFALEMVTHKEDDQAVSRFLERHGIPDHIPIIGLHPGAKNTFKQWSQQCFIEVGRRLVQHLGCQILVSGDHSEAMLLLDIASSIPGAIPIAGELNLSTFTALLKKMTVFITNDTGPMHLAFAAKTPTVALFGPTDPKLCGPFHVQNAIAIAVPKTCTPCLKKKCAEPFCLLQIGPDAVYDAALKLSLVANVL